MKTKLFTVSLFLLVQHFFTQIVGTWKGNLSIQGVELPLVIKIRQQENQYYSVLFSPKQSDKEIAIDKTEFQNSELFFEIKLIQVQYRGILKNGKIEGTFTQNGYRLPLILELSDAEEKKSISTVQRISNRSVDTEKLSRYIDFFTQKQKGIGSISIFKNGKEIYSKNFGQYMLPIKKYDENTGYQVGSVTKLFLSTMIMQEVEKGKLSLSDKLSKFYPNLPNAEKITLENMLNHTSGLGDYVGKTAEWLTKETIKERVVLDTITKQGVLFQPNEKVKYSNSAYYLLCKILEKINKKPFNVLLKERITKKLGLKHTFSVLDNPKNIFTSYQLVDGKRVQIKEFNFNNVLGAGDITSTAQDLNLFVQALFSGKLVKKETLEIMHPKNGKTFGLGMMHIPFYNISYYGHGGTTLGTDSTMAYNLEDDIAISVIINGRGLDSSKEFNNNILKIIYNEVFEF